MAAYRIRELGSRIVVGTEQESILICKSIAMAEQVIADAKLLETASAKQLLARRPKRTEDE